MDETLFREVNALGKLGVAIENTGFTELAAIVLRPGSVARLRVDDRIPPAGKEVARVCAVAKDALRDVALDIAGIADGCDIDTNGDPARDVKVGILKDAREGRLTVLKLCVGEPKTGDALKSDKLEADGRRTDNDGDPVEGAKVGILND